MLIGCCGGIDGNCIDLASLWLLKELIDRRASGGWDVRQNSRRIQTWEDGEEEKCAERGPSRATATSPGRSLILDMYPHPPYPNWLCGVHTFPLTSVPRPRSRSQPRRNTFDPFSFASGEAVLSVKDVIPYASVPGLTYSSAGTSSNICFSLEAFPGQTSPSKQDRIFFCPSTAFDTYTHPYV